MERSKTEEAHKKVYISDADTVSDPRAVVIMRLDADTALGAVE